MGSVSTPIKKAGIRPVENCAGNRSERGIVAGRCGDVLKIQANFESCYSEDDVELKSSIIVRCLGCGIVNVLLSSTVVEFTALVLVLLFGQTNRIVMDPVSNKTEACHSRGAVNEHVRGGDSIHTLDGKLRICHVSQPFVPLPVS